MKDHKKPKKNYIRDGRAPIPEKEVTSKIMSLIRAKNTKPELRLRKALWASNIRGYRIHWKLAPGKPDIAFPSKKIAIFVNGCFWHRCPYCEPNFPKSNVAFWENKFSKNIERDKLKTLMLKKEGWDVLTMWECQINTDLKKHIKRIQALLNG